MISISAAQMRELDRKATEVYGIPSLLLMENAGRGTAEIILEHFRDVSKIAVFCGKGNNGGDGFVIARHLLHHGKTVQVVLLADPADLKGDARINFEIVRKMTGEVLSFGDDIKCDLIVDAILGIGVNTEVTGIYRQAMEWINQSGKPVIAVDIPSGLDADTGKVHGIAVKADLTATMAYPKKGLLAGEGPHYCGKIHVVDIGIPKPLAPS